MELKIPPGSEFFRIHDKMSVDLLHPSAGAFLGAFMSEGNLTDELNLKITCKDLNFINSATLYIREVLGSYAATETPPTNEDKRGEKGFHKYYSKHASRLLNEGYGIKTGRKVLNNCGLPPIIMKNLDTKKAKEWFVSYLKMRLSGDGHVRNTVNKGKSKNIITRRVALSRNISIKLDGNMLENIDKNYEHKKPLKEYPKHLVEILRHEARKKRNYPKEFLDIKRLMSKFFGIESKIYPYGLRCIYFDKKRNKYIVSAIYKIVISRKDDIIKFKEEINFADFDVRNRKKLINLVNTYKNRLWSTQRGLLMK